MEREDILRGVRAKYRSVCSKAVGQFPYPVGRPSAQQLGYRPEWLCRIPSAVIDLFVGIGNPFRVFELQSGRRVLDVGCGCGMDSMVASMLVGPSGAVTGVDLTPEMFRAAQAAGWANLRFVEGNAERLPFSDGEFDVVISNGVLNLIPDKPAAFREIRRVLKAGGVLAAADLVVVESIPDEMLASMDAWST